MYMEFPCYSLFNTICLFDKGFLSAVLCQALGLGCTPLGGTSHIPMRVNTAPELCRVWLLWHEGDSHSGYSKEQDRPVLCSKVTST